MKLMKKGQGMSINVIIIAALALIVLVILVMVFTGRIGIFEKGLSKEGKAELVAMRITYGDCAPTATSEANFDLGFGQAESLEAKELAKANFKDEISRCKSSQDKTGCESSGCRWS